MAQVLSFPFRVGANGRAVTVEQYTPRASQEALQHLLSTRKGERPYVPSFGITDPTFTRLDPNEIRAAWQLHGDGRAIAAIATTVVDGAQRTTVELA